MRGPIRFVGFPIDGRRVFWPRIMDGRLLPFWLGDNARGPQANFMQALAGVSAPADLAPRHVSCEDGVTIWAHQCPLGQRVKPSKADNVDRGVVEAVRAVQGAPMVEIKVVLTSQPDVIECGLTGLTLRGLPALRRPHCGAGSGHDHAGAIPRTFF